VAGIYLKMWLRLLFKIVVYLIISVIILIWIKYKLIFLNNKNNFIWTLKKKSPNKYKYEWTGINPRRPLASKFAKISFMPYSIDIIQIVHCKVNFSFEWLVVINKTRLIGTAVFPCTMLVFDYLSSLANTCLIEIASRHWQPITKLS